MKKTCYRLIIFIFHLLPLKNVKEITQLKWGGMLVKIKSITLDKDCGMGNETWLPKYWWFFLTKTPFLPHMRRLYLEPIPSLLELLASRTESPFLWIGLQLVFRLHTQSGRMTCAPPGERMMLVFPTTPFSFVCPRTLLASVGVNQLPPGLERGAGRCHPAD